MKPQSIGVAGSVKPVKISLSPKSGHKHLQNPASRWSVHPRLYQLVVQWCGWIGWKKFRAALQAIRCLSDIQKLDLSNYQVPSFFL